jgi:hypothetical protein
MVAGTMVWSSVPASAHERRTVGRYQFVVGWGDEPAYSTFKNSVQLSLSERGGDPVTDLGDTLKVEVSFGDQTTTLALEPSFVVGVFGEPGDYRAWLTPTRPGSYTFHFTGTIKGARVDQRFTCGEETFDCITDVAEIQFPAKDPSTAQIAERLDRELPRTDQKIAAVRNDASTAQVLGIIGIALGALGVIAGLVAMRRKARP